MSQEKIVSNSFENSASQLRYNHARWEKSRRFLRFLIRVIGFNFLARLDRVEGLEYVPAEGGAILMINHIAFIDPIVVLHVLPRNIVPMAKIEVYDYPLLGIFPRLWGVIPVRREEFDRRAVQTALEVLRTGEMILIAPEATRSPQLQQGKEGVAYIASRSGVPVIPVGIDGTPGFPAFRTSRRWREKGVTVIFGRPFRYRQTEPRPDRNQFRLMTDEALYRLASLLPVERRGFYSDLERASQETIELI
jgi:1-acyl-sn-glycerol-3-phosphate acyltransferase